MPLFHRHSPKEIITAQLPNAKTTHLSSHSVSTYPSPLPLSEPPPPSPPHLVPSNASHSSEFFLDLKSASPRVPVSRKSAWGRTIRTENEGEVFESDAFAVEMPTTRVLVGEGEVVGRMRGDGEVVGVRGDGERDGFREGDGFRGGMMPSRAQVEAYQTYKEKARQVRARNNSEGVRVPSKILSYDYAGAREGPTVEPAGAWPGNPGGGQRAWDTGAAAQATRHRAFENGVDKGARSISKAKVPLARKPLTGHNSTTRFRYPRDDSVTGASISSTSTSSSPKIKIRLVPRATAQQPASPPHHTLLSTPSPPSSSTSRSSSPGKPNPHFAYTTSASEQLKDLHSTVFTHTTAVKPPPQTPKRTFATILHEREVRKKAQSRNLANRFAWLRPSGPRVAKPVSSSTSTSPPTPAVVTAKAPPTSHTYIDPFMDTTPPSSHPISLRKLTRPPELPSPTRKFESGFAQIRRVGSVVVRLLVLVYVLVAVYFVLDAVREAVVVVGAPFRVGRRVGGCVGGWVGRGLVWVYRGIVGGVKVVVGRW